MLEVLQHGSLDVIEPGRVGDARLNVHVPDDAHRLPDAQRLRHEAPNVLARLRVFQHRLYRHVTQDANGIESHVVHELEPDGLTDFLIRLGGKLRAFEKPYELGGAIRATASRVAEHVAQAAALPNAPRRHDLARNVHDRADHLRVWEKIPDHAPGIDAAQRRLAHVPERHAILHRYHGRIGARKGRDLFQQRGPLVRLKRKQQKIEGAERAQVVADRDRDGEGPQIALDVQAVTANCRGMLAARHNRDRVGRPGKGGREESADRAGPHDRDPFHLKSLKATGRFELPNGAFAEPCLTTWLRRLEV